jgi:sphinganine-1-phosphate aldolase
MKCADGVAFVKGSQEAEIGAVRSAYDKKNGSTASARATLSDAGRSWNDIRMELVERKEGDYDWRAGRLPLYVYHDDEALLSVSREAYDLYFSENALGGRAFPSLAGMEEDIIGMALALFRAPEGADGTFTSGGTESIFLAVKTARDYFRARHPNQSKPKIVIPRTAHPAFNKAAQYLDIDVVRSSIGSDLRCNIDDMQQEIDARTMMIVGSAPCYPYGVFDSISRLGEVAASRDVWLHVDACLGGFLAPFAQDVGFPVPTFDFSITGVTSLSADLHKYGFSAKGASVLLYRSAEMRNYQRFQFEDWPRGSYCTESFLGSRPGGAVASAWAVSQYLGKEGYRRLAKKTMEAKLRLIQGIEEIGGLEVIQPSDLTIVLYRSIDESVDINAVAELLGEAGWFVARTREPLALHLALNAVHAPVIGEYLQDLRDAVHKVRSSGRVGVFDDRTY